MQTVSSSSTVIAAAAKTLKPSLKISNNSNNSSSNNSNANDEATSKATLSRLAPSLSSSSSLGPLIKVITGSLDTNTIGNAANTMSKGLKPPLLRRSSSLGDVDSERAPASMLSSPTAVHRVSSNPVIPTNNAPNTISPANSLLFKKPTDSQLFSPPATATSLSSTSLSTEDTGAVPVEGVKLARPRAAWGQGLKRIPPAAAATPPSTAAACTEIAPSTDPVACAEIAPSNESAACAVTANPIVLIATVAKDAEVEKSATVEAVATPLLLPSSSCSAAEEIVDKNHNEAKFEVASTEVVAKAEIVNNKAVPSGSAGIITINSANNTTKSNAKSAVITSTVAVKKELTDITVKIGQPAASADVTTVSKPATFTATSNSNNSAVQDKAGDSTAGPPAKRKRRSKNQIRIDQQLQELKKQQQLLADRLHGVAAVVGNSTENSGSSSGGGDGAFAMTDTTGTVSLPPTTASNSTSAIPTSSVAATSMAVSVAGERKRKLPQYDSDAAGHLGSSNSSGGLAPKKRGRPFGVKSPRYHSAAHSASSSNPTNSSSTNSNNSINTLITQRLALTATAANGVANAITSASVKVASNEASTTLVTNDNVTTIKVEPQQRKPSEAATDVVENVSIKVATATFITSESSTNPPSSGQPAVRVAGVSGRGGRGSRGGGRAGRAQPNRQHATNADDSAASSVIFSPRKVHNIPDNNGATTVFPHATHPAAASLSSYPAYLPQRDFSRATIQTAFSSDSDRRNALSAAQTILDLQNTAVESMTGANVAYYQLILQHRSVFNTLQMPLPSCSDVCSALDLLDCMIDALYMQLKDVRAKQFSYEAVLDDSKVPPSHSHLNPNPNRPSTATLITNISENNQWTLCKAHLFASTIAHPPPSHLPSPSSEAFLAALRQKITANNINSMYSKSTATSKPPSAATNSTSTNIVVTAANKNTPVTVNVNKTTTSATASNTVNNKAVPFISTLKSTASSARAANIPDEPSSTASSDRPDVVNIITVTQTVNDYMNSSKSTSYKKPCELPSYQTNVDTMRRNRHVITQVLRSRKLARRRAWDDLADGYLAVQHKWSAHVAGLEVQEGVEKEGPTLRTAASHLRAAAAGGSAVESFMSIRSSTAARWSSHSNEPGSRSLAASGAASAVARSDYEQERLLQEKFGDDFRQQKIQAGLCEIPDMVCPWPFADKTKNPPIPQWPDSLRRFDTPPSSKNKESRAGVEGAAAEKVDKSDSPAYPPHLKKHLLATRLVSKPATSTKAMSASQEDAAESRPSAFPPYAHTYTEYLDLNNHLRLTTDGRRQQCHNMPVHSLCVVSHFFTFIGNVAFVIFERPLDAHHYRRLKHRSAFTISIICVCFHSFVLLFSPTATAHYKWTDSVVWIGRGRTWRSVCSLISSCSTRRISTASPAS